MFVLTSGFIEAKAVSDQVITLRVTQEEALWLDATRRVPGHYLNHHGTWLVAIGTTPRLVEFLRQQSVRIVGFETYDITSTGVYLRDEPIADFSSSGKPFREEVQWAADASLTILEDYAQMPIFVEFVLEYEETATAR